MASCHLTMVDLAEGAATQEPAIPRARIPKRMTPNCHKKVLSYQRGYCTKGRAPKKPGVRKGRGPRTPSVAAPLAAAGCCGNCYHDTGGRSHASAPFVIFFVFRRRSMRMLRNYTFLSRYRAHRPLLGNKQFLEVSRLKALSSLQGQSPPVQSSPISTTFSRDEKFKTSPTSFSSSKLSAHQMARRMSS